MYYIKQLNLSKENGPILKSNRLIYSYIHIHTEYSYIVSKPIHPRYNVTESLVSISRTKPTRPNNLISTNESYEFKYRHSNIATFLNNPLFPYKQTNYRHCHLLFRSSYTYIHDTLSLLPPPPSEIRIHKYNEHRSTFISIIYIYFFLNRIPPTYTKIYQNSI